MDMALLPRRFRNRNKAYHDSSDLENLKQKMIKLEELHAEGRLENLSDLAECYTELAFEYSLCMSDAFDSEEVQELILKAIALWEMPYVACNSEERKLLIDCYHCRGRHLYEENEYEDALMVYQKAVDVMEHTSFGLICPDTSDIYRTYADTLYKLARYREYLDIELKLRQEYLSTVQDSDHILLNKDQIGYLTTSAADTMIRYGYAEEAISTYEAGIKQLESIQDSYWDCPREECNRSFADALYDLGYYDKALEQYQTVIALCQEAYQKPALAHTYLKCAYTLNKLDRNSDALSMCQKSISLYEELPNNDPEKYREAVAYAFCGSLFTVLNLHDAADQPLKNAFTLLDLMSESNKEIAIQEISRRKIQKANDAGINQPHTDTSKKPEDKIFALYICSKRLDELHRLDEAAKILKDVIVMQKQVVDILKTDKDEIKALKDYYILYCGILEDLGKTIEAMTVREQIICLLLRHQ